MNGRIADHRYNKIKYLENVRLHPCVKAVW